MHSFCQVPWVAHGRFDVIRRASPLPMYKMRELTFENPTNRDIASALVGLLTRGELVFFAGAALSMAPPSNLPLAGKIKDTTLEAALGRLCMTKEDAESILTEQRLRKLRKLPLEVMFQFVHNAIGPVAIETFKLLDTGRNKPKFNHNHKFLALAAGDMTPIVLTTNWDHLIEDALASVGKAYTIYATDEDIVEAKDIYRQHSIPVVKLHGTIERDDSIIVTMEQAGERLSSQKAVVLRKILQDYYVCFVGYGMGDYDIYSTIRSIEPARVRGLYTLMKPPREQEDEEIFRARNARLLSIAEAFNGVPIVLDIQEFFVILCNEAFPSVHGMHVRGPAYDEERPDLEQHIREWSKHISPYEAHSIIGSLYYHVGEGVASAAAYQLALDQGLSSNESQRTRLLLGRGYALARTGDYRQYLRDSRAAHHLAKGTGNPFDIAESLFHAGDAFRQLGGVYLVPACVALHRASRMYRQIEGRAAKHGLGSSLLSSSLIIRAVLPRLPWLQPLRTSLLERLEHAYSLLGGPNGNALRIIGERYGEIGEVERGLAHVAEAELVCRWHEDDVGLANTMRAKARILRWNDRAREARKCYLLALRVSRRAGDTPGIIKALDGLAQLALDAGRYYRCRVLRQVALRELGSAGWRAFGLSLPTRLAMGLAACHIRLLVGRTAAVVGIH